VEKVNVKETVSQSAQVAILVQIHNVLIVTLDTLLVEVNA